MLAICSRQSSYNPDIRHDGSGNVSKAVSVRNALAFYRINDLFTMIG